MSYGLTEWEYNEIGAECERLKAERMAEEGEAVKVKTIWLSKDPSEAEFLVEKVQDSIQHLPGTYITEPDVEEMCNDPLWKVIVQKFKQK